MARQRSSNPRRGGAGNLQRLGTLRAFHSFASEGVVRGEALATRASHFNRHTDDQTKRIEKSTIRRRSSDYCVLPPLGSQLTTAPNRPRRKSAQREPPRVDKPPGFINANRGTGDPNLLINLPGLSTRGVQDITHLRRRPQRRFARLSSRSGQAGPTTSHTTKYKVLLSLSIHLAGLSLKPLSRRRTVLHRPVRGLASSRLCVRNDSSCQSDRTSELSPPPLP